jgi:ABC-2 type transport system ATP-binding protein
MTPRLADAMVADRPDATQVEPAIRVAGLTKRYGPVEAVRGIDFEVTSGEIFGLIGPDGAGKTSVFQVLGGVMSATAGEAIMLGRPARDARPSVGYLTQVFSLYHDLSVSENLRYMGELRRLPAEVIDRRGRQYLDMFGLGRFMTRLAGQLSGGMKQKLSLACALIIQPKILLLDEPTTGVDPVSRREFWDALATLSGQGITIVIATPYLDEAERCTRIALMHDGRVHDVGTPSDLRQRLGLHRLVLRVPDLPTADDVLRSTAAITDVQRFGDRLDVLVDDLISGEVITRQTLRNAGIDVNHIRRTSPTLENTFVTLLRQSGGDITPAPFPVRPTEQEKRSGTSIAIGARHLTKKFGAFEAVKDVSLTVRHGEIYGLLGANGAGKTTTIKMLCGLTEPTSGETHLAGESGFLRSALIRQRVGYMSQKFSLYEDLTIEENLDFFAGVYHVPLGERADKKRWVLSFAGLDGKGHLLTASLPGGWKQRIAFGAAVMHEPSVLFLDEPTSGVDPLARRAFWRAINDLADRGAAILVTTHYLEEAEQCNRLGLLVAGELVAEGTPSDLKTAHGGHLLELATDRPQRASSVLKAHMDRWRISLFGDRLHVLVDEDPQVAIGELVRRLAGEGIKVMSAHEEPPSLEDVFITVVERMRVEGKTAEE